MFILLFWMFCFCTILLALLLLYSISGSLEYIFSSSQYIFFKISLFIWCLLWFHINLLIFLVSVKDVLCIFIGNTPNLYTDFGRVAIFTILTLLIHEVGMSFYFLKCFSIFFFRDLKFSLQRSFTALVRFIIRNLIAFDAVVNGNVSMISKDYTLWSWKI